MPFFIIGRYIDRFLKYLNRIDSNKYIKITTSIIIFTTFTLIGIWNTPQDSKVNVFHCIYGNNILIYYITTVVLCLSMIATISTAFKNIRCLFIETISKGTLLILGLHLCISWQIPHIVNNELITTAIKIIIIFGLSYPMILLSEKYFPFMIGKRIKKR